MSQPGLNGSFFTKYSIQISPQLSFMSCYIVVSTEAPSKVFLTFFLFSDSETNHLRSRIERGLLNIFSRHICSAVTETIRVTNYATSFGAKKMFRKLSSKLLR